MVLQVAPAARIKKKRAKLTAAQKALHHDKLIDLTMDIEAAKENYNDTAHGNMEGQPCLYLNMIQ
jgi:chromosome segregation ATPase